MTTGIKQIAFFFVATVALAFAGLWLRGAIKFDEAPKAKTAPLPMTEFINPFETPQERAEKEKRKGFVIDDGTGNLWGRIARADNGDVTKGLPVEQTVIYSGDIEPIITKEADGWHTRFKLKPTPTP